MKNIICSTFVTFLCVATTGCFTPVPTRPPVRASSQLTATAANGANTQTHGYAWIASSSDATRVTEFVNDGGAIASYRGSFSDYFAFSDRKLLVWGRTSASLWDGEAWTTVTAASIAPTHEVSPIIGAVATSSDRIWLILDSDNSSRGNKRACSMASRTCVEFSSGETTMLATAHHIWLQSHAGIEVRSPETFAVETVFPYMTGREMSLGEEGADNVVVKRSDATWCLLHYDGSQQVLPVPGYVTPIVAADGRILGLTFAGHAPTVCSSGHSFGSISNSGGCGYGPYFWRQAIVKEYSASGTRELGYVNLPGGTDEIEAAIGSLSGFPVLVADASVYVLP